MDFDVLPGPTLPELARTALARAAAATVTDASPADTARTAGSAAVAGQVPVRAGRDGSPLLLPATGSPLARWLASGPAAVTVSVPASPPFDALRLTGTAGPLSEDRAAGLTACPLNLRTATFTSPGAAAQIPVGSYRAARPDPLWRVAAGVLRHLESGHMAELIGCVRAHGLAQADWVIPRGLDRYGLELLVLTANGVAAVRLAVPGGPVASIDDAPTSIRTALTCRCQAGPGQHRGPAAARRPDTPPA